MANTKITSKVIADDAILTANIADDQVTADKLANAINTSIAAKLPLAGGTMTGNIVMGDDTSIGIADDAERIEFDGAGDISFLGANVGIGTTSPDDLLHLVTSSGNSRIKASNGTVTSFSGIDSANTMLIGTSSSHDVRLMSNDSVALIIKSDGKVGIGTTAPSTLLHLGGTAPGDSIIRQDSTSSGTNWEIGEREAGKWQIFEDDGDSVVATFKSDGNVGIGTTSPTEKLEVAGNIFINTSGNPNLTVKTSGAGNNPVFRLQADTNKWDLQGTFSNTNDELFFMYNSSTKMAIDNNGNVGIGTTSPTNVLDLGAATLGRGLTFTNYSNLISEYSNASLWLSSNFYPNAGASGYKTGATGNFGAAGIRVHGTGGGSSSGIIQFYTDANSSKTAGAAFTPTARMIIDENGCVGIGGTGVEVQGSSYGLSVYNDVVPCWFETRSANSSHEAVIINRKNSAGTMIAFAYNDAEKGTITQSGGSVSYNAFMGSHYTESSEDVSSILLGTVMETVDALVENKYEDQKRLAKCKVSSTSESPNVYGVWIEDNQTGQIAALGASWCRINSGVTVSMGDLLVSNGDGTAKVQSDDILRSKTIGKVTSTVKKETYSDGSYVVPVVLYCG